MNSGLILCVFAANKKVHFFVFRYLFIRFFCRKDPYTGSKLYIQCRGFKQIKIYGGDALSNEASRINKYIFMEELK